MGQAATKNSGPSCDKIIGEFKDQYNLIKSELCGDSKMLSDKMIGCLSSIALQTFSAACQGNLVALATSITSFIFLLLVNKRVKECLVELLKVGGNGVGDFQNELQREFDFVDEKLKEIDKLIHETENGTYLKLASFSQNIKNESALRKLILKLASFGQNTKNDNVLRELIQEFNNSMFEIKKRVKECQLQLQISYNKVNDFLKRRRNAWVAGTAVASVGGGATAGFTGLGIAATIIAFSNPITAIIAVVGGVAGVVAVASGTAVAVLNQNNGEEKKFREIETKIKFSQENLNESVTKVKKYISELQKENIPVADW